jgi:hypothetical protein
MVVSNDTVSGVLPEGSHWVLAEDDLEARYALYRSDLVDEENAGRHDAAKLTETLINLLEERTGPLVI